MRNRTENQVTLALIRHGETQANKEHRYLGKTDESLSENGRRQLSAYKQQGRYPQVDFLFTSPMKRCMETAEILYPDLCPTIIQEWSEMDFGRFEYKNYEELKGDAQYQAWVDSGGTLAFPEGESRDAFIRRCEGGWINMCRMLSRIVPHHEARCPNQNFIKGQDSTKSVSVGAIVHGGTLMALISTYGTMEYFDCQAANGRGYICHLSGWGDSTYIKEVIRV